MFEVILDLMLLAIFVVGLTAFLGIITHGLAIKLFGKHSYLKFSNKSKEIQSGWKKI